MDRTKTSKRHAASSLKPSKGLRLDDFGKVNRLHPTEELADADQTAKAIFECLKNNDPEGVMEMVELYLEAVNKALLLKKAKLHKSTMYSSLKHRNPTIKTLAKLMSSV